ncbi:MAG: carotene hydroxylase [Sphingobacteriia bacterium]|jgi:beta-carotene 3-hydroxylase|nr:carotene hydroxylase [Sphingobacteriia bacterium]
MQAILIIAITFILTEISAWVNHKYLMHGFMWYFHADHHKKDHGSVFERNDLFFLLYAVPSWLLIMTGMMNGYAWYTWVGFGIAAYGLAYFLVHDVIIHQRFKIFTKSTNVYVLALRRAHKMHHKHLSKHNGESFGMLLIHPKYFAEARKLKQGQSKV